MAGGKRSLSCTLSVCFQSSQDLSSDCPIRSEPRRSDSLPASSLEGQFGWGKGLPGRFCPLQMVTVQSNFSSNGKHDFCQTLCALSYFLVTPTPHPSIHQSSSISLPSPDSSLESFPKDGDCATKKLNVPETTATLMPQRPSIHLTIFGKRAFRFSREKTSRSFVLPKFGGWLPNLFGRKGGVNQNGRESVWQRKEFPLAKINDAWVWYGMGWWSRARQKRVGRRKESRAAEKSPLFMAGRWSGLRIVVGVVGETISSESGGQGPMYQISRGATVLTGVWTVFRSSTLFHLPTPIQIHTRWGAVTDMTVSQAVNRCQSEV